MLIPHGPYALVGNPNLPDGLRMVHIDDLTPEEAAQVGLPPARCSSSSPARCAGAAPPTLDGSDGSRPWGDHEQRREGHRLRPAPLRVADHVARPHRPGARRRRARGRRRRARVLVGVLARPEARARRRAAPARHQRGGPAPDASPRRTAARVLVRRGAARRLLGTVGAGGAPRHDGARRSGAVPELRAAVGARAVRHRCRRSPPTWARGTAGARSCAPRGRGGCTRSRTSRCAIRRGWKHRSRRWARPTFAWR